MVDVTETRAAQGDAVVTPIVRPAMPAAPAQHEPLPPAGWYVDPYDADQRRWWSGTEWTDHVRTVLPTPTPAYVAAPAVMNVRPMAVDARGSIRDLAADLGATRTAGHAAAFTTPIQTLGTVATARQTVPWYEKPERNPVATAGFVFGVLALLANPAAVMSVFALLLGAIGLAKSSGTFQAIGRRRAVWAIVLGIIGGLAWGVATWWAFEHPEMLASLRTPLS